MKKNIILLGALAVSSMAFSQVGIDTDTPKATLDIKASPTSTTKIDGLIAPRLKGSELKSKNALYTSDQDGAIVYVTEALASANTSIKTANVTSIGYYYFDKTLDSGNGQWVKVRNGYDPSGTEPWYNQADGTQATSNTQNIYQNGRVGIKKTTDFITGSDLDVKGSIRGGNAKIYSSGTTQVTVGSNSLAFGSASEASEQGTIAIGPSALATKKNSFALGNGAKTGYTDASTATSTGDHSYAIGEGAITGGNNAYALGYQAVATGNRSFSLGETSTASGNRSYALGYNAVASGTSSYAIGDQTGTYPVTASGDNSYAIGRGALSNAQTAFAIGNRAEATGVYSYAIGAFAKASNNNAFAIGNSVVASGKGAFAFGTNSTTNAADNSFAIGQNAVTNGYNSYAIGYNVIAPAYNSVVLGRHNLITTTTTTDMSDLAIIATDPIFQLGNGTRNTVTNEVTRRNAITVQNNGKMAVGNHITAPAFGTETLKVYGSIATNGGSYPDYVFEDYYTGNSTLNPSYQFTNLYDTEKYIKENNHLPGVTSIKDLEKTENGYSFNLTDLSTQTLEKVEELYLHTIEQQKQIDELRDLVKTQQEQINRLLNK